MNDIWQVRQDSKKERGGFLAKADYFLIDFFPVFLCNVIQAA